MPKQVASSKSSHLSFSQLTAELRRRQRGAAALTRRRDKLAAKIDALDEQIRMMGGKASAGRPTIGRRGRRSNKVTLAVVLSQVLAGKTMRVTDAAEAVKAAGYKTGSKSFRVQVNIALIKNPKLFRRAGWGLYTAK